MPSTAPCRMRARRVPQDHQQGPLGFERSCRRCAAIQPRRARKQIGAALKTRYLNRASVYAALASVSADIASGVESYGSIRRVPAAATPNMRNDMYLAG